MFAGLAESTTCDIGAKAVVDTGVQCTQSRPLQFWHVSSQSSISSQTPHLSGKYITNKHVQSPGVPKGWVENLPFHPRAYIKRPEMVCDRIITQYLEQRVTLDLIRHGDLSFQHSYTIIQTVLVDSTKDISRSDFAISARLTRKSLNPWWPIEIAKNSSDHPLAAS